MLTVFVLEKIQSCAMLRSFKKSESLLCKTPFKAVLPSTVREAGGRRTS